jgi:hypothetical protein
VRALPIAVAAFLASAGGCVDLTLPPPLQPGATGGAGGAVAAQGGASGLGGGPGQGGRAETSGGAGGSLAQGGAGGAGGSGEADAAVPDAMGAPDAGVDAPVVPTPDAPVAADAAAPDTAAPAPDMAAPDLPVPDMAAPDMPVPDMAAPDMPVPDMAAPDTAAGCSACAANAICTPAMECAYSLFPTQTPIQPTMEQNPLELGTKFQSSVAGKAVGIRYWRVEGETGPHTGRIWSTAGAVLGTVAFTNETATGWQQAMLGTPVLLEANTVYVVSVEVNVWFGGTAPGLMTVVSNGPLSTIADGNNGVFGPPGTYPTMSHLNQNYFRDVLVVPTP